MEMPAFERDLRLGLLDQILEQGLFVERIDDLQCRDAVLRLDHLNSDIRAALRYSTAHDPHTALRLASAIPRWCRFRPHRTCCSR